MPCCRLGRSQFLGFEPFARSFFPRDHHSLIINHVEPHGVVTRMPGHGRSLPSAFTPMGGLQVGQRYLPSGRMNTLGVGYFDLLRPVFQVPVNANCAIAAGAVMANNNPNTTFRATRCSTIAISSNFK